MDVPMPLVSTYNMLICMETHTSIWLLNTKVEFLRHSVQVGIVQYSWTKKMQATSIQPWKVLWLSLPLHKTSSHSMSIIHTSTLYNHMMVQYVTWTKQQRQPSKTLCLQEQISRKTQPLIYNHSLNNTLQPFQEW